MTFDRSLTVLLLVFAFLSPTAVFSQTQAELDQVKAITKRVPTNCSALIFIAGTAQARGDYKKAESSFKKILDIYKNDPGIGPKSVRYAWILSRLALCHLYSGEKTEAARTGKEALALIDGQTPENNPDEANFLVAARQNCTLVLGKDTPAPGPAKAPDLQLKSIPASDIGNLAEQEKQTREYLRTFEQNNTHKSAASESAYTRALLYQSNIYTLEKRNAEAELLFKKAINLIEKQSGKNSAVLLTPLSNYGYLLQQSGKKTDADAVLARMQKINTTAQAKQHAQIGVKP